ncbi:hypothetical protein CSV68_13370 [Sporosarcina sp. P29]|nr:hypothetical protein CSV68_13370 [Sporosarcina sp. P29]
MVIIRGQAVDALTPRIIPRGLFYFNRVPLTKQECSRWISAGLETPQEAKLTSRLKVAPMGKRPSEAQIPTPAKIPTTLFLQSLLYYIKCLLD